MDEKILYEKENVKVTSARFIVGGETYPIVNISSVKTRSEPAKYAWGLFWLLLGVLFICSAVAATGNDTGGFVWGFFLVGIGGFKCWFAKTKYIVVLTTAGSEVKALSSPDNNNIEPVIKALNDAIVYRG